MIIQFMFLFYLSVIAVVLSIILCIKKPNTKLIHLSNNINSELIKKIIQIYF